MERDNELWIDNPERSRSKMFSFRLTLRELENITAEAQCRGLSLSALLREALSQMIGEPSEEDEHDIHA